MDKATTALGRAQWLNLLNSEVQTVSNDEIFVQQVRAWTYDRLRRPCDHLKHLRRCHCHNRDVIFSQRLQCRSRCVFLNEDDVRLEIAYLLPDDLHEAILLVNLSLHVSEGAFLVLHVA